MIIEGNDLLAQILFCRNADSPRGESNLVIMVVYEENILLISLHLICITFNFPNPFFKMLTPFFSNHYDKYECISSIIHEKLISKEK